MLGGAIGYPLSKAREVLRFYSDLAADAPDELATNAGYLPLAEGPILAIVICYSGEKKTGEKLLHRFRSFETPILDSVRSIPFRQMQKFIPAPPNPVSIYLKSTFVTQLSPDLIDSAVEQTQNAPGNEWALFFEHFHKAPCRVSEKATAFGRRRPGFSAQLMVPLSKHRRPEP